MKERVLGILVHAYPCAWFIKNCFPINLKPRKGKNRSKAGPIIKREPSLREI